MTSNTQTVFSRRQVAVLVGVSEDEVKEKDGSIFHPTKGPDGSLRYASDEVIPAMNGNGGDGPVPTGAICATAFELFQAGKNLPDVVISLKQSPAMIRALRAEYDAMAGCLTLPSETMSLISKISCRTVGDASDVLKLIDSLRAERDAAYEQGFADASDPGEVLDPQTGKMISVGSIVARSSK
jgi:hypothetical protein